MSQIRNLSYPSQIEKNFTAFVHWTQQKYFTRILKYLINSVFPRSTCVAAITIFERSGLRPCMLLHCQSITIICCSSLWTTFGVKLFLAKASQLSTESCELSQQWIETSTISGVRRKFHGRFHSVARGSHLYLVCAVCDVKIWRHIHAFKQRFGEVCWHNNAYYPTSTPLFYVSLHWI